MWSISLAVVVAIDWDGMRCDAMRCNLAFEEEGGGVIQID